MTSFRFLKPGITSTFFTLFMTLQIAACSVEENALPATDNNISDTPGTSGSTGSTGSTGSSGSSGSSDSSGSSGTSGTNQAAVITGTDNGSVTEDIDPNNNNLLEVSGKLNITDSDAGEAAFIATTQNGNYGDLTIDASGNWNYSASNTQAIIQNMAGSDTFLENFTVSSIDGTTQAITITIIGADDPLADVSLSWVAPTEREDNTGLSLSEIAGYKIYYGSKQGNYSSRVDINDSIAVDHTLKNLTTGTYYFVITTIDIDGQESQYSPSVKIVI